MLYINTHIVRLKLTSIESKDTVYVHVLQNIQQRLQRAFPYTCRLQLKKKHTIIMHIACLSNSRTLFTKYETILKITQKLE